MNVKNTHTSMVQPFVLKQKVSLPPQVSFGTAK